MTHLHHLFNRIALLAGLLLTTAGVGADLPPVLKAGPAARAIIDRWLERSEEVQADPTIKDFTYTRRVLREDLDGHGSVIAAKTREYETTMQGGMPVSRLTRVDGRPPAAAELPTTDRRPAAGRPPQTGGGNPRDGRRVTSREVVSAEVLRRFAFEVEGQETIQGRPSWCLSFRPGPDKKSRDPSNGQLDRFLEHLQGRLWIDQQEHELARLECWIKEPVRVMGGLGALERLDLKLERTRFEDGTWYTQKSVTDIISRKLLSISRQRTTENATNPRLRPSPARASPAP